MASSQTIALADDASAVVTGLEQWRAGWAAFACASVASLGALPLVTRWVPRVRRRAVYRECALRNASHVRIVDSWGQEDVFPVESFLAARPALEDDAAARAAVLDEVSKCGDLDGSAANASELDAADEETALLVGDGSANDVRTFVYRLERFVLTERGVFAGLGAWRDEALAEDAGAFEAGRLLRGLPAAERAARSALFGANDTTIPMPSWGRLLVDEVLHPFYVFQVASMALWCVDAYFVYAACIAVVSLVSVGSALVETRHNLASLRRLCRGATLVAVLRDGWWATVPSTLLAPGDVIQVAEDAEVPADCVLLSGEALVDEALLTGESVPLSKTAVGPAAWSLVGRPAGLNERSAQKHVLYAGTRVVQTRARVSGTQRTAVRYRTTPGGSSRSVTLPIAVVVRTGFLTTKGQLIRSLLFPQPHTFAFYRDSFRFLGFLFAVAAVGCTACIVFFVRAGVAPAVVLVRALDLVTIVVPPGLPAAMSVGISFALRRLRRQSVVCTSPPHINIAGRVSLWAFDKTGTLTEPGLFVRGVQAVETREGDAEEVAGLGNVATAPEQLPRVLRLGLGACHCVRTVRGSHVGDPLDVRLLEWSGWTVADDVAGIEAPSPAGSPPPTALRGAADAALQMLRGAGPDADAQVAVLRVYEFCSAMRRMSVLATALPENDTFLFTKGAPEAILPLVEPSSVPRGLEARLTEHLRLGRRVIAVAGRRVGSGDAGWRWALEQGRAELEDGPLALLGLAIFENPLKRETRHVLKVLGRANLRTVMCTGDNVLTAVAVARQAGLLDSGVGVFVSRAVHVGPGELSIVWESADDPEMVLDGATLAPGRLSGTSPPLDAVVPSGSAVSLSGVEFLPVKNAERPLHYSLAVTGQALDWVLHDPKLSETQRDDILRQTAVYARMAPEQKQLLVGALQTRLGYSVGFCGDGANDVGALKTADAGVSLSDAEASAAAPFTSAAGLDCVLRVVREGRCAFVTSLCCFKYMALYSLIQFASVTLLYAQGSNLGDGQFLFIDLCVILPAAVFMSWTGPSTGALSQRPPGGSLMSTPVLASVLGQALLHAGVQAGALLWARSQPWFIPRFGTPADPAICCMANTVVFCVSCAQYLVLAVVFSAGPPHRAPLHCNLALLATVAGLSAALVGFLLFPSILPAAAVSYLELEELPLHARQVLLAWCVAGSAASAIFERVILPFGVVRLVRRVRRLWV